LDESQCATSAVKVQSQKSLNMQDNSSAIFTGIKNLKNIDVVLKPTLPELMCLIKNDTCSMSGQAVSLSKPKEELLLKGLCQLLNKVRIPSKQILIINGYYSWSVGSCHSYAAKNFAKNRFASQIPLVSSVKKNNNISLSRIFFQEQAKIQPGNFILRCFHERQNISSE